jgi:hypothetical protein
MKYLIATVAKKNPGGAPIPLTPKQMQFYVGNGMWISDPVKARLYDTNDKPIARAADPNMHKDFVCGVAEGDYSFSIQNVETDVEKMREKIRKQEELRTIKVAMSKLTPAEQEALGLTKNGKVKKALKA